MARGRCRGGGADHEVINATRTVWNFQKPAWNVGEFYFGGLVGNLHDLLKILKRRIARVTSPPLFLSIKCLHLQYLSAVVVLRCR